MTIRSFAFALLIGASPALAQLPASETLFSTDLQLFHAELDRIETLLKSAADNPTVTYAMARTWAAGKQWPETIQWLQKVAAMKASLDPMGDSIFAELRGTREFEAIEAAIREATPPVSHSRFAFKVPEGDLVPESLAYDPRTKLFYFGSTTKGKVLRCSTTGNCTQFATGLGVVFGIKVQGNGLWLLSNRENESALIHYDLDSARVIRRYAVTGPGPAFNDLAIARSGDIYLTDTRAGSVWHLANGTTDLTKLPGRFESTNGVALSSDGTLLYVSAFPDGISVMDLKTLTATPIGRPAGLCLGTIDGLYFYRDTLIAIQNGVMTPRVVRFALTRDLRSIARFEVLERRNPLFDGVTTGVVVGSEFFYMANTQDDKKTGFNPITVLKLRMDMRIPAPSFSSINSPGGASHDQEPGN